MNIFRHSLPPAVLAVLLYSAGMPEARALSTNLAPVADTAMRSSSPDANFGAATSLPVGVSRNGTPVNRCLFQFGLDSIPTNAVIANVSLAVSVNSDPTPPASFSLSRLLADWSEAQATWNIRLAPAVSWAAAGGLEGTDFVSTPSATVSLSGGVQQFSSDEMIADVQMWLADPGTNFGWILLAVGEPAGTGKQIASREATTAPPVLTVEYTLPAPALPPTIYGTALAGDAIRFSFSAEAGRSYTVEYLESLDTNDWNEVANIPAQPADTTVDFTNAISSNEGFFRVRTP